MFSQQHFDHMQLVVYVTKAIIVAPLQHIRGQTSLSDVSCLLYQKVAIIEVEDEKNNFFTN